VNIICKEHGEFELNPNDHLSKKVGCPICKESNGESIIRNILKGKSINYISQYRFKECRYKNPLPFDFYLPDYNTCIEYDGRQHFEVIGHWGGLNGLLERRIKDNIKNEYCNINNIRLIRVAYNDDIIMKLNTLKDGD
jgi:hypothetical protein